MSNQNSYAEVLQGFLYMFSWMLTHLLSHGRFMVGFNGVKIVQTFLVTIPQMAIGSYQLHDSLIPKTVSQLCVNKPKRRKSAFETYKRQNDPLIYKVMSLVK